MHDVSARRGKAREPAATPARPLSISSDVRIVGAVHFDGPVEIEGTIEGEVHCASVKVARYGTVMGKIVADEVTVSGGVSGSIYANRLVLKPDCDVEGEIYHRELSLEQGSYFDGKSRPHKDPLSLANPPAAPARADAA
jgi:cytoskeletal protein CcmA (bactofilin family)